MKVVLKILLLFVLFCFPIAYAAESSWVVAGEELAIDGDTVLDGTVKWISSDIYPGGVLVLQNYNGGTLKVQDYSSDVYAIQLIGNNTITAEGGVGIVTNCPIVFLGDGILTVNAAVAMGAEGEYSLESKTFKIVPSNITPTIQKKEEVKEEELDVVEPEKNEVNKTAYLIFIGVFVVVLFIIAFVIMGINKRRG